MEIPQSTSYSTAAPMRTGAECYGCIQFAIGVSSLVIAALAITGTISGPTAGWTLATLVSGSMCVSLLGTLKAKESAGDNKSRTIDALACSMIILLGLLAVSICGGCSLLSGFTVGWVFCGAAISFAGLGVCAVSSLVSFAGGIVALLGVCKEK